MSTFSSTNPKMHPSIELEEDAYPRAFDRVPLTDGMDLATAIKSAHDDLLSYLRKRLDSDASRGTRVQRFARMDRVISTWQRLSAEDSKRQAKADATGNAQAIAMNLPVTHTHIDDMTAFFAETYSPNSGSYFGTPKDQESGAILSTLMTKMNEDSTATNYYTELTQGSRAFLKYNIGGFHLQWIVEDIDADSPDMAAGMNWCGALDMYNVLWDQSVSDPAKIRLDAEWAAVVDIVNRRHLVRREMAGIYAGVQSVLDQNTDESALGTTQADYYKHPPVTAGVSPIDESTGTMEMDWTGYTQKLGQGTSEIQGGFERVIMYCWLNPADFGLSSDTLTYPEDGYFLWKFMILNGERIILAEPVNPDSDDLKEQGKLVIPIYMGYLNLDDMKGASRSIAELLSPFQMFSSFLLNAHVAGARGAIWGLKAFDPNMFDIDSIDSSGGTVGYLKSKAPGRDVRTGLTEIKGSFDGSNTMTQVDNTMSLAQRFFPAQGLPSQIADIDRATTNQVGAVLQGVSRRLHMLVRMLDSNVFGPMRFDQYRNIVANKAVKVDGLKDGQVRKAIGSGLEQLNRDLAEQSIRQMMMSMLSNPNITEQYDVNGIFTYWASMLKMPVDTAQFQLKPNPNPVPATGAPAGPTGIPPVVPGA